MAWVASAVVGSALIGAYSANKAAGAQADAAKAGMKSEERMFEKQQELQAPFREAGLTSQNKLMDLLGLSERTGAEGYGSAAQPFGMEQFQADPGYAFRLKEGLGALDRSAVARGGLLSGNQLRGVTQFGQELGSQEYQNAFNRYQAERASRLNPLQSLMGAGQSSANYLSGAAGQFGQSQAAGQAALGNIRASGYTGAANALTGAMGQGINYYQNQQAMNRVFPQATAASYPATASSFSYDPSIGQI